MSEINPKTEKREKIRVCSMSRSVYQLCKLGGRLLQKADQASL